MNSKLEAELVAALHEGVFETPLWSTFLTQLRNATGADYATLIFQAPARPFGDAIRLFSGEATLEMVEQFVQRYHPATKPLGSDVLREGVPHAPSDSFGNDKRMQPDFLEELDKQHRVSALRLMRVTEKSGIEALLSIARHGKDFSAREAAVLQSIAPVLRGVLRIFVAMERERFAASLTAATSRRLQFGWLSLDEAGDILDCDEQGEQVLSSSGVLRRSASGQLRAKPAQLEREIFDALNRMIDNPQARPKAIALSHEPWLDMLMTPVRNKSLSARAPVAIAYVHGDSWNVTDRCDQIAELFALTPAEARVALVLSRGMTIAETASEFGLALGTVRNHLKAIYAKTGARGLPDLVRIVMRSIAGIAPEA